MKHLENLKAKKVEKSIVAGSRLYYLGKSYYIEIEEHDKLKNAMLEFTHSKVYNKSSKRGKPRGVILANRYVLQTKSDRKNNPIGSKMVKRDGANSYSYRLSKS